MSNEQFSWEKPLGIITQYDEITFGDNANIGESTPSLFPISVAIDVTTAE